MLSVRSGSIKSRTRLGLPPLERAGACRDGLIFGSFSALEPSFGHTIPRRLVGRISRSFGHPLALGGLLHEFVRRINQSHGPLTSWVSQSLLGTLLMADHDEQPALDTVSR
jgi:hypothetical protein